MESVINTDRIYYKRIFNMKRPKLDLNRNSKIDAKQAFEKLIPFIDIREHIIDFLAGAIDFADTLNSNNWNVNLDKNEKFIRFNVGQEYCIEISKQDILIICDRTTLKSYINTKSIPIIFRGHIGKERVDSINIDEVPNCLSKTKNSVGCIIKTSDIPNYLNLFIQSNRDFIKSAINTNLMPQMREAHSKGVIEYINNEYNKNISNPIYAKTNLKTLSQFLEEENRIIKKAQRLSSEKRRELLSKSNPTPDKITVSQVVFKRNQYVVIEVQERANGICEKCRKPAPFRTDNEDKPYLEVHHIIPLAEGGEDTVENAIALCPNCHRHAHYGKNTFKI